MVCRLEFNEGVIDMYHRFIFCLIFIFDSWAYSCAACYGKDLTDDNNSINKIYKQKSEFYSNQDSSTSALTNSQTNTLINKKPICDFSKGNDNCKPQSP